MQWYRQVSLEYWDACWIPGLAQWVKDPVLLKSKLHLGSGPWPKNSMCLGVAKRGEKIFFVNHPEFHGSLVIKDLAMSLLWYWFNSWPGPVG